MSVSGQFVDSGDRRILLVWHETAVECRSAVVVFPALTEEMNKSRRLLWDLGQRLAAEGVMLVVPDLSGTGDSEGEFLEARWSHWCADMAAAKHWIAARGITQVDALAVRFGACLYADCADLWAADADYRLACWQPELDGAKALKQLMRLKVMSDRVTWGEKTKLGDLQATLKTAPVEIGGYQFHPELAASISQSTFDPAALPTRVSGGLFDWSRPNDDEKPADGIKRFQAEGQRFWTAVEPEANERLVADTGAFLAGAS
ncbi:MAG: hypothetical protein AB8F65_08770 [Woeseiaceae bacterium]